MTTGRTPPTRATSPVARSSICAPWPRRQGARATSTLRLYTLEGFLLRLAASANSQDFVLKGGVLLAAYALRRPTADVDFAALNTINEIEAGWTTCTGAPRTITAPWTSPSPLVEAPA